MKTTFEDIQIHPSYTSLPPTVREVLRVAFSDPDHDILKSVREVSPRAARANLDVQINAIKKLLSRQDVQILVALWVFGIDLHALRGVPDSPADVEVI
jgi:hypothetical protein